MMKGLILIFNQLGIYFICVLEFAIGIVGTALIGYLVFKFLAWLITKDS